MKTILDVKQEENATRKGENQIIKKISTSGILWT